MFAKIVSDKMLDIARQAGMNGDSVKARRAFSQARFWGGVTEAPPVAIEIEADVIGIAHVAPTQHMAHALALEASRTY